ncbi:tyrosine recombinase XerC [Curtobacterium flaccumfaciens]|uniref:site-specific integrase n=1 Tax=Curtobacterium flaccumfaciens TaxID=2035 RepID=UPI0039930C21
MTWQALVSGLSAENRAELAAALADIGVDDGEPLATWLRHWFAHIHSKKIAPKTIASYRTSIEQYIVPAIGTVGLRALTPTHVGRLEEFIRGRGLGGASAQQAHRVLSLALRDAVRYEHIPRNVATLVSAPKKKPAQLVALTADDGARILETAHHDRLGSRIAAALLTGGTAGGTPWPRARPCHRRARPVVAVEAILLVARLHEGVVRASALRRTAKGEVP